MSRNVDIIAVAALLLAAAMFGGVRDLVTQGLFGPSHLLRIERNGSQVFVEPAMPHVPRMPRMPRLPELQRN